VFLSSPTFMPWRICPGPGTLIFGDDENCSQVSVGMLEAKRSAVSEVVIAGSSINTGVKLCLRNRARVSGLANRGDLGGLECRSAGD
jgi:hypothetical protein